MWFIYALLGAVGKSYSGFFRKKLAKDISGSMYMWVAYTLILVLLTPFMWTRTPELTDMVLTAPLAVVGAVISLMVATWLNLEALKREELSYIAPLNAFVPVFTLIIAMLFLQETPPPLGILGVGIIVLGAYIVNIKPGRIKWYDPLKRLFTNTGAVLSLGVALGYAMNTVLYKQISNQGFDALSIMYVTTLVGWLLLVHVPVWQRKDLRRVVSANKLILFGAAGSSFAAAFFHILTIANTYASYAVSVRRFDILFSVILGWRYLKESNIRIKLAGSLCMVAGAVLMALG